MHALSEYKVISNFGSFLQAYKQGGRPKFFIAYLYRGGGICTNMTYVAASVSCKSWPVI